MRKIFGERNTFFVLTFIDSAAQLHIDKYDTSAAKLKVRVEKCTMEQSVRVEKCDIVAKDRVEKCMKSLQDRVKNVR
jgi:maltodextrin utilization protein YvdJ